MIVNANPTLVLPLERPKGALRPVTSSTKWSLSEAGFNIALYLYHYTAKSP